jgi:cytochrome b561/polyisoprenoid-binding protein YceI
MNWKNTEEEYGIVAKAFHWAIAVLILGLVPVGLGMGQMENSPLKFEIYAMHKSFGLLVFFLGLGRILWRFISPPPDHLTTHEHWEVTLAGAAHFWLYVCIIGMPLSGWLMSSAGEFPVPFFGFPMPYLIGKDEKLLEFFGEAHEILGYTLLFILALHMAGALKHHILDKDETLRRMTVRKAGLLLPVVLILAAGLSYAASGWALFGELRQEEKGLEEEPRTEAEKAEAKAVMQPDTSALPEHGWAIVPEKSKLGFEVKLSGASMTGFFPSFRGDIVFNPQDLAGAKADITINLKEVDTGDTGRDETLKGSEWFDLANYPEGRFTAEKFEQADGDNYVAIGNLTLRGVTMPAILPFTLEIQGNKAHMTGEITLNRLDYGIGSSGWQDDATVSRDVKVTVDVTAVQ